MLSDGIDYKSDRLWPRAATYFLERISSPQRRKYKIQTRSDLIFREALQSNYKLTVGAYYGSDRLRDY